MQIDFILEQNGNSQQRENSFNFITTSVRNYKQSDSNKTPNKIEAKNLARFTSDSLKTSKSSANETCSSIKELPLFLLNKIRKSNNAIHLT
jgi:hypothetical protein